MDDYRDQMSPINLGILSNGQKQPKKLLFVAFSYLFMMEHWTVEQSGLAVVAFYKNWDSFLVASMLLQYSFQHHQNLEAAGSAIKRNLQINVELYKPENIVCK